jgi:hypothetical protein
LERRGYASDNDLILVTNNASDFRQRYAAQPLHAGLVILTGLLRTGTDGYPEYYASLMSLELRYSTGK